MISHREFDTLVKQLELTPEGVAYAHTTLFGDDGKPMPPTRQVENFFGNSLVRYPSGKMGFAIPCESRSAEFALTLVLEFDRNVLFYCAQPEPLTLQYMSANGRPVTVDHKDDRFVIRRDAMGFIEAKTQAGIRAEALKKPNRYVQTADGLWICPPGQEAAKRFGFFYEVWTPNAKHPALMDNLQFLQIFFDLGSQAFHAEEINKWKVWLRANPGQSLAQLDGSCGPTSPEFFRWAIAYGHFYCDLQRAWVAEPERLQVFDSQATAEACALSNAISNLPESGAGDTATTTDPIAEALGKHTTLEIDNAVVRQLQLDGKLAGKKPSDRSKTRWRKGERAAKANHEISFIGLIGDESLRGNRKPRLDPKVYLIADEIINKFFLKSPGFPPSEVHALIENALIKAGLPCPSERWTYRRIEKISAYEAALARGGPRKAYQVAPFLGKVPNHGDYPFHIVYVDATEMDLELIDAILGAKLGKAYFAAMRDGATRAVLAHVETFDPPGRSTIIALIRECVRLHKRLPLIIVVDNAMEYESEWFQVFTAFTKTIVIQGPPHGPRSKALIENFLKVLHVKFIHLLSGSTQIMKDVRQVTKSVNPKTHAIWNLPAVQKALDIYVNEHYNTNPHEELLVSPAEAMKTMAARHKTANLRPWHMNQGFRLLTMVSDGTRLVTRKGVKVSNDYFWSDALIEHIGDNLEVRHDLEDITKVSICIKDPNNEIDWVVCRSKSADRLEGLSYRDLAYFSGLYRRRSHFVKEGRAISRRRLAQFILDLCTAEDEYKKHILRRKATRITLCVETATTALQSSCVYVAELETANSDQNEEKAIPQPPALGPVKPLKKLTMPNKYAKP